MWGQPLQLQYTALPVSVDLSVDLGVGSQIEIYVIISMMVMCNANDIIEHDRKRSRFCKTPINMEYDNSSIEY